MTPYILLAAETSLSWSNVAALAILVVGQVSMIWVLARHT